MREWFFFGRGQEEEKPKAVLETQPDGRRYADPDRLIRGEVAKRHFAEIDKIPLERRNGHRAGHRDD